ncbi:hypothetical protein FOA43_000836 [Brettanomyces nanus]|uniref:Vacuolar protein sorting-associated protein 8 central domain-containing protein n=1 Tax=Eeniella nana TaxID=13502 RepID=A0A875RZQ4_EENNA|nr:uncharacterized protein FOA43_000836 [Brettanomyces nanus]QPG73525.1 hypothetical protein FOA43_000836 [Brettanomyces nanus]
MSLDLRLRSKLSLSQPLTSASSTNSRSRASSLSSLIYSLKPETVSWPRLRAINDAVYNRNARILHGDPIAMTASDRRIAIATSKGYIFVYQIQPQQLYTQLGNSRLSSTTITSLSFSLDSTYLAVGYHDGHILLWDLSNSENPLLTIQPVHQDIPIIQLAFMAARHTALISIDESGVMVSHQGGRTLIGYYSRPTIMMGDLTNHVPFDHVILGFSALPVGSRSQLTDSMGVMAILTADALVVVSTLPDLQTYFKVKRPKSTDISKGLCGNVAWYPATSASNDSTSFNPPYIAYSWSNSLTLFEVYSETIADSSGKESVILKFENRRQWQCTEPIMSLQWLNSKIITALTKSQRLIFIGRNNLKVLSTVDMISKHIKASTVFEDNGMGLLTSNYTHSFKALKSSVFVLGKSCFYVGILNDWADELFSALKDGHYIEALDDARRQYDGDCDLALLGLPQDDDVRHKLMRSHITRLLEASLNYVFSQEAATLEDLSDFLLTALTTCASTNDSGGSSDVYDTLYEKYADYGHESMFFDILEPQLLNGQIRTLPPAVLKRLVEYYISQSKEAVLEQLLCKLDLTQLDMDLTIRLCKKHQLVDTLAYIWNVLMADYITPVMDAIKSIVQSSDCDIKYIYTYISYILTGRQYPTDNPIDSEYVVSSKLNIYYLLFNGAAISYPPNTAVLHVNDFDDPSFPYLTALLHHDSFRTLSSLNEGFEDDLLNDDEVLITSKSQYQLKVNRQYIVDVLLGIYRQDNDSFTVRDRTFLAIFVARNCPKYPQFIRLSDSVLDEVIEHLCSYSDEKLKGECELSLQSLLSVYKPAKYDTLVVMLEKCGFYNALLSVYRNENRYLQILEVWISQMKSDSQSQEVTFFQSLPSLVKESLNKTSVVNRLQIETLIKENFQLFIKDYPEEMAELFSLQCPLLNEGVMTVYDDSCKYLYLRKVISMELSGGLPYKLDNAFNVEYAKMLRRFDHDKLARFVVEMGENDEIRAFLDEYNEVEIAVELLIEEGELQQAISKTVKTIESLGQKMVQSGYDELISKRLFHLLDLGFKALKTADNTVSIGDSDLTLNETLLLHLIETSVKLFVKDADASNDVLNTFKRLTQQTFTSAISEKQDCSDSFLKVFYSFLKRSSLQVTTLGDVRPVLNEIFLSYSHDEVILKLILKLLNDDIYQDLVNLELLRRRGWSPVHLECEVCGKKVWGAQMSFANYDEWQDHRLKEGGNGSSEDLQLHVFQCRHTYHTKCLENMGVKDNNKYCIICKNE